MEPRRTGNFTNSSSWYPSLSLNISVLRFFFFFCGLHLAKDHSQAGDKDRTHRSLAVCRRFTFGSGSQPLLTFGDREIFYNAVNPNPLFFLSRDEMFVRFI